jgi:hypothetical protein
VAGDEHALERGSYAECRAARMCSTRCSILLLALNKEKRGNLILALTAIGDGVSARTANDERRERGRNRTNLDSSGTEWVVFVFVVYAQN